MKQLKILKHFKPNNEVYENSMPLEIAILNDYEVKYKIET
jgi:hypothetical protein